MGNSPEIILVSVLPSRVAPQYQRWVASLGHHRRAFLFSEPQGSEGAVTFVMASPGCKIGCPAGLAAGEVRDQAIEQLKALDDPEWGPGIEWVEIRWGDQYPLEITRSSTGLEWLERKRG